MEFIYCPFKITKIRRRLDQYPGSVKKEDLELFINRARQVHRRNADMGRGYIAAIMVASSAMQNRAFSVVGPLLWNGLPLDLRSLPKVSSQKFLQQLKTTLFCRARVGRVSEYSH